MIATSLNATNDIACAARAKPSAAHIIPIDIASLPTAVSVSFVLNSQSAGGQGLFCPPALDSASANNRPNC